MSKILDFEAAKLARDRRLNNVVNLNDKDGYSMPIEDYPDIKNAYVARDLIAYVSERPGREYVGYRLDLVSWIPEWHQTLHGMKEIITSRVDWGPPQYFNCTPEDWLHLVK